MQRIKTLIVFIFLGAKIPLSLPTSHQKNSMEIMGVDFSVFLLDNCTIVSKKTYSYYDTAPFPSH